MNNVGCPGMIIISFKLQVSLNTCSSVSFQCAAVGSAATARIARLLMRVIRQRACSTHILLKSHNSSVPAVQLKLPSVCSCLQHLQFCLHAFRDYAMWYIHVCSSCQLDEFSSGRVDKSSCLVKTASTTSQQECLHQGRPKFGCYERRQFPYRLHQTKALPMQPGLAALATNRGVTASLVERSLIVASFALSQGDAKESPHPP